jgi:predicted ArsR family transcriptional regulator
LKTAIRAGLAAGERLETWTAGAREQLEDLVEETRAEQRRDDRQRGH